MVELRAFTHQPLALFALFCLYLRVGVVTGKRLTEFIRHFEPLRVEAYWVEENLDHVQSKFKFNAHGRLFCFKLNINVIVIRIMLLL